MPYATVTTNFTLSAEGSVRLRDAVARAVQQALEHPELASVRVHSMAPERCLPPPSVRGPFALIEIDLLEGRTPATKRRLYEALAEAVATVGVAPTDYRVLLRPLAAIDVCVGQGRAACDVDLGYRTDV